MSTDFQAKTYLSTLISKLSLGIITFDLAGQVILINNPAKLMLGFQAEDDRFVGMQIESIFRNGLIHDQIQLMLENDDMSMHLVAAQYGNKILTVDCARITDSMVLSLQDVTDEIHAKDTATQSLLLGLEKERRRISKDIHDGIGPSMSTVRLHIDAIKNKVGDEVLRHRLDEVNAMLAEVAQDIRQISHDLMPSSLVDFGVITALSNFARRINEGENLEVFFNSDIEDGTLSKEYEVNLFRICQELVNNALKYSECRTIQIQLKQSKKYILLTVEDDGKGMNKNKIRKGMGLYNIATRVNTLHGKMDIDSTKNKGVCTQIVLPRLDTV